VADAIIDGLRLDQEVIFPDPMSAQLYAAWAADHKQVERPFAKM